MQPIARIVTEVFLMVLATIAAPETLNEFRIDAIDEQGYMDTLIVKRVDGELKLYDDDANGLVEFMTIKVSKDNPLEYEVTDYRNRKETINFEKSIKDFSLEKLRKEKRLTLEISDGTRIKMNRSGKMVYLTHSEQKRTYAVQCIEEPKKESD